METSYVTGADYEAVIADLCRRLIGLVPSEASLRVAVDGRTGAGKTCFAGALTQGLSASALSAVHAQIDDFHNPRSQRHEKGRYSAEGYYRDARNLDAIRHILLDPLGPGGSGRYALASFDLAADRPVEPDWRNREPGLILIVDGTFLQRPELRPGFDVTIFLDVSAEEARRRGTARDVAALGAQAEALYRQRYEGAFALYEAEISPQNADAVVQLEDFSAPSLMIRPGGPLDINLDVTL